MTTPVPSLSELLDAHFAGRAADVPDHLRAEFDQALAAHRALQDVLDETVLDSGATDFERPPPEVSDDYHIERELGRGGMGVVYLAQQRSLNRRVALKVLRPGERAFGAVLKRFRDEAQHLARLRHPHIVTIHEVGEAAGEPYFTMDYVDGESLSAILSRGPLSPTQAVEALKQVAEAVQHAHKQGIIHRDLKPGNVLMDRSGRVFVTDFGLARDLSQAAHLTETGELLGTPQYMAPEQARGQTELIGEATDIHALGMLLFEMLAGRPAFGASSPAVVLVRLLNEEPPALRGIDRRIPRDLETIALKCLQKSPAARYANVSALLEDVRRFEAGEPLVARRTGIVTRGARWVGRHWRMAAAVVLTAAVVLAVAPRVFDKSVEQLIAWGEEELRDGRPELAAQVLRRAWSRSEPEQRQALAPKIAEAVSQMNNAPEAVDLALSVLDTAPEVSFGKHDYVVAQALVMAARKASPNGVLEPPHGPSLPAEQVAQRELAARRLSLFLDGPFGSREERAEAERSLQALDRSLRGVVPQVRLSTTDVTDLPVGTPAELQACLDDSKLTPWDRGKAGIALGRSYEQNQAVAEALVAYRAALAQLKLVHPYIAGVASTLQASYSRTTNVAADSPECRMMRDLLASIARLDPEFVDPAQGGLRLRFDHPELLAGFDVAINLELTDPAIGDPFQGMPHRVSSFVSMSPTEPTEVRVLDGRYRLRLAGMSRQYQPPTAIDPSLLDLSAEDWPKEIEIQGGMVELPPMAVRQLAEILPIAPAERAQADLSTDPLAWNAVRGAAWYEVQLGYFIDSPSPSVTYFAVLKSEAPQLRLLEQPDRERRNVGQHWTRGRTAMFRVAAFDAEGRRIATTVDERQFLIAAPLPDAAP